MFFGKNELIIFASCHQIAEKFANDGNTWFFTIGANIHEIIDKFTIRFNEFEMVKNNVVLFKKPLATVAEEQPTDIQLEMCALQADPFLQNRQEFFMVLPWEQFPNLLNSGQKTTWLFGSILYMYESVFFTKWS